MKVLAGDIGGTRSRFAIVEVDGIRLDARYEKAFRSKDYGDLEQVLAEFVDGTDIPFESACFGIAGPILNGRCIATNLPWHIDPDRVQSSLALQSVRLINDLAANALGIQALSEKDLYLVNPGRADRQGNACIIAAGTGLGEAGMFWDGEHYQPFPSEGGHCDFAPSCDFDYQLQQFLATRFGHVSWERVVSGMGIVNIFEFLCAQNHEPEPDWFKIEKERGDAASAIAETARSKQDRLCLETLEHFLRYYGAEAGNLALKTMATGGIYVGGGIAPKLIRLFQRNTFFEALTAKGRMQNLLSEMPVKVILNDRTALFGAAIRAANPV